jgi:hypothetical protein
MMTFRSKFNPFDKANYDNFAFKKSEILEILQILNSNFNFEAPIENQEIQKYPLYFKNQTFTPQEVACMLTNYDPLSVQNNWKDVNWRKKNPDYIEALDFAFSAVRGDLFDEIDSDFFVIESSKLKDFFNSRDIVIDGFNNNLFQQNTNFGIPAVGYASLENYQQERDQILKENEELKDALMKKEDRIKELELIQTNLDESKLGNTRAENNVAKLILALSAQANIDTSKPYAQYESLRIQAELLGIDKFPSDENVATWLKRANSQNPN